MIYLSVHLTLIQIADGGSQKVTLQTAFHFTQHAGIFWIGSQVQKFCRIFFQVVQAFIRTVGLVIVNNIFIPLTAYGMPIIEFLELVLAEDIFPPVSGALARKQGQQRLALIYLRSIVIRHTPWKRRSFA